MTTTTTQTTDYAIVCGKEKKRKKEMERKKNHAFGLHSAMKCGYAIDPAIFSMILFFSSLNKEIKVREMRACVWCGGSFKWPNGPHMLQFNCNRTFGGQITQPTNDATTLYRINGHSRQNKNACIRLIIFIYYWPLSLYRRSSNGNGICQLPQTQYTAL